MGGVEMVKIVDTTLVVFTINHFHIIIRYSTGKMRESRT